MPVQHRADGMLLSPGGPLRATFDQMTGLSPGWPITVEDATPHHWIGTSRGLVLGFADEGSYADVRHVHAGARVIQRLSVEQQGPVKLLFVLPSGHPKPPEVIVRSEMAKAGRRLEAEIAGAAMVVLGTGFAAAIQRAVAAGVLAVLRTGSRVKVVGTVRDGLALLIDARSEGFEDLARRCDTLAEGPPPASARPPSAIPRAR